MMSKYEWNWKLWAGIGIILLAAAIAVGPMIVRGPSCGSDYAFHFNSWHDAQINWRQGVIYPHWMPNANHKAGEPRFIFYPPLTWMLGAALGLVLPLNLISAGMSYIIFAATGLSTRALARQALPEGAATLSGCVAIFFGYSLSSVYLWSLFGASAGGIWIPLLLLYALRDRNCSPSEFYHFVWKRAFDTSTVPLALAFAGAWLSNLPLGLMASYLLAAVVLVIAVLKKSWAPIVRALTSAVLGMGLIAFFLIPATWEQRWVEIGKVIDDPYMTVENNWLFGWQFSLWPYAHNTVQPALNAWHDASLMKNSLVIVAMAAVALSGALVSALLGRFPPRKQYPTASSQEYQVKERAWWVIMALIPFAVLFLNLPISLPIWNLLPKLRFLQFPSRWLVVLVAPMAVLFTLAVWPSRPRHRIYVVALSSIIFVAISAFTGRYLFMGCGGWHPDIRDPSALEEALSAGGEGVEGTREYTSPPGAKIEMVPIGLPDACFVKDPSVVLGKMADGAYPVWKNDQNSCIATFTATAIKGKARTEHLRITAFTTHPGYLILHLRNYPAWRVTVNGRAIHEMPWRDDGLMAVPVPQGTADLAVDWVATVDVLVGRWISGLAVLLLIGLWLLERKLSRSSFTIKAGPADTQS